MYSIDDFNSSILHLLVKTDIDIKYLDLIIHKLKAKTFDFDTVDLYNNSAIFYIKDIEQHDMLASLIDLTLYNKNNQTYKEYIIGLNTFDSELYNLNKYKYDKLICQINKINLVI